MGSIKVNKEFLEGIRGLYLEREAPPRHSYGSGGAFYSIAQCGERWLWGYWEGCKDVWDDERRVNRPLTYGYEETEESAREKVLAVIEENRPDHWRPYFTYPCEDDENFYELCETKDGTDFHSYYPRHRRSGGAAATFHKRLAAEKRAKRKKRVGAGRKLEFAYCHISYVRGYWIDPQDRKYKKKRINPRSFYGQPLDSKYETEKYRIYKKTAKRIYLEREAYKDGQNDIFGDYRDFTRRAYVIDRQEFESTGWVFHGQLGWVTNNPLHPEGAVPDTPQAIEKEPCFVALGLKFPCTVEDVKKAYRKKSMETHPDRGGDPDEFARITGYKDIALSLIRKYKRMKKRRKRQTP